VQKNVTDHVFITFINSLIFIWIVLKRKAKLPACFSREYGMEVAPFVFLRDPCENEIEVKIVKKNGRVYFDDGWSKLKDLYNIRACSWITIIYAKRNLFLFRGETMRYEEFLYPRFSPPK
jgi:hypothetical protein